MELFNNLEGTLRDANCPKDFFGEIEQKNLKSIIKEIRKRKLELDSICKIDKPDAHILCRIEEMKKRFLVLARWAVESILNDTYDKKLTYCLKIEAEVKEHLGNKFFYLKNLKDLEIYFKNFTSVHFEGSMRCDPVRVIRNGGIIKSGRVLYRGTHAGADYFCFDGEDPSFSIQAENFNVGDIVEIETQKYFKVIQFGRLLVRFNNFVLKFVEHAKNNNKLSGNQIDEIAEEANSSSNKDLAGKTVFFLGNFKN